MLQAARKMAGWEVSHRPARMHPVKFHKMARVDAQISFIQRGKLACAVVRSCLTSVAGPSKQLTLAALLRLVSTSHFHVDQYEAVRRTINMAALKEAVKSLESQGEVDVTVVEGGSVSVALSPTHRGNNTDPVEPRWKGAGTPLKMRKSGK